MKTEKEKMLSNELYNHKDAELTKERNHAYELTLRYNQTKDDETELRTSILQQLAGKLGNNVVIKPPFQCDYGYNLILGDNVFMNYGCSILDCNVVEIGNNVLMAAKCTDLCRISSDRSYTTVKRFRICRQSENWR